MRGVTLESYAKLRLCFTWTGNGAEEVEIVDYH
jgi:plasmid maintenance system killer protein